MAFGPTLRAMRIQRGISQSQLSRIADVDHSTVSRLEAGTRYPTGDMVRALADALNCTVQDRHKLYHQAGFVFNSAGLQSAFDLASWGLPLYNYTPDEIRLLDTAWRAMLQAVHHHRQGVPT